MMSSPRAVPPTLLNVCGFRPGEEHERTRRRLELLAVAFDLQHAGEQVDALVLAGVRVPRRAAVNRDGEDGELAAGGAGAGP
jgi:hypothetical protein